MLPQLAPGLLEILQAELAFGNEIQEATAWLPHCHMLLILKRRFCKKHPLLPGISFAEINDYHYWQAEYRFEDGQQVLACGFAE